MATFQERLIQGMKIRGYKQKDLVNKTGMDKARISHYMNGRYEAKQEALYLLSKALEVNEAWLMGHDVPMDRTHEEKKNDLTLEESILDQIKQYFGRDAWVTMNMLLQLNKEGIHKANTLIADLLEIKKYRKDDDE